MGAVAITEVGTEAEVKGERSGTVAAEAEAAEGEAAIKQRRQ